MLNSKIITTQKEFEAWRRQQSKIIFVPTMGNLHKGHQKLIEVANELKGEETCTVLVSIFVNPLQFGTSEDFEEYPRSLNQDCQIATEVGADMVWAPEFEDIFPRGIQSHCKLEAPIQLKANLCGATRKGHFDGVVTVVSRLLALVKPNYLVLGEKDWQQLTIIKKLIKDLDLNIKVKSVPTYRDKDGLSSSSRNKYLNITERKRAAILPKKLKDFSKNFYKSGNFNLKELEASLKKENLSVEYIQLVDTEYLQLINKPSNLCLLGIAIKIGKTRLIDHTFLMNRFPIVAIDGPAGAGKSTVTKAFAKKMGLTYLDTGAMYRAVTWLIKENNIDTFDEMNIAKLLEDINLKLIVSSSGDQKVFINEKDVTNEIRSPAITADVSTIASHQCVREKLTSQQKKIGLKGGLVAEGRDIGTSVFPSAELKVFLTASTKERAKRRALDLRSRGFKIPDIVDLEKEIINRDKLDSSREISPLLKAKDAKELITDGMTINDVVDCLIEMFRLKVPEEVWPSIKS